MKTGGESLSLSLSLFLLGKKMKERKREKERESGFSALPPCLVDPPAYLL